ncbi:MAG: hypothetical protein VB050_00205 [Geobacteraceae bacterium]|nr:hypothetical protein [Geobacteraceae bacterium]
MSKIKSKGTMHLFAEVTNGIPGKKIEPSPALQHIPGIKKIISEYYQNLFQNHPLEHKGELSVQGKASDSRTFHERKILRDFPFT